MKHWRNSLLVPAFAMFCAAAPTASRANGAVHTVHILQIAIFSGIVTIHTDATSVPGTPSCSTSGYWHFAYNLNGAPEWMNAWTAALMTARATGIAVDLSGDGTCSAYGNTETLSSLYLD